MSLLDLTENIFFKLSSDGMCQSGPSPENSSYKVFQKRRVGYTRVGGLKGKEQWGNERKQIPPLHLEGKIGKGWGCQNLRAWSRSPLELVLVRRGSSAAWLLLVPLRALEAGSVVMEEAGGWSNRPCWGQPLLLGLCWLKTGRNRKMPFSCLLVSF